jgi:hypothetical protein
VISLLEQENVQARSTQSLSRPSEVLDPPSLLWKMRTSLPRAPASYEVLDGKALWRVQITAVQLDPKTPSLIRVEGKIEPTDWGGSPDPLRSARTFTLLLTADARHLPVKAMFPLGWGEVKAELVSVSHEGSVDGIQSAVRTLLQQLQSGFRQSGRRGRYGGLAKDRHLDKRQPPNIKRRPSKRSQAKPFLG